jgi:phenylalanyl-tRNA synthetase beta subunit
MFNGKRVGSMGVIHPEILENFNIPRPVVALELNLQKIVEL